MLQGLSFNAVLFFLPALRLIETIWNSQIVLGEII